METDAERTELEAWRSIVEDGDWAVKKLWEEYAEGIVEVTPRTVKSFLWWLVRTQDSRKVYQEDIMAKCASDRKYRMKYCTLHGVFYPKNYPHVCNGIQEYHAPVKMKGQKKNRG